MTAFPQIVVGTYEEFVLGYKPQKDENVKNMYKLAQTYATHSHQASVRCLTAHGEFMASAGADEYINIYDMTAMEVSTVINYHDATVTCLEFTPDGSHLITANQNGDIAIFRCRNWTLVKLWKEAHKHANGVTSISVHPSGSLLLTTGADNIVRFWNLVKGRQAYAINFSKKCSVGNSLNFGKWSKNGRFYGVCIGNRIEIYKMTTAAIVYEIITSTKITCAEFVKKNLLCVGTEDGLIEIHSITTKQILGREKVHDFRVKSMSSFSVTFVAKTTFKLDHYLVTVDSKGLIKLWLIRKKGLACTLKLKGNVDSDCRITCLTVVCGKDIKEEKKDVTESLNVTSVDEIDLLTLLESSDEIDDIKKENIKKRKKKKKSKKKVAESLISNNVEEIDLIAQLESDGEIDDIKEENLSRRKRKKKSKHKHKVQKFGSTDTNNLNQTLFSVLEGGKKKKGKKRKMQEIFFSPESYKPLKKKKKSSKSKSKRPSGEWSVEQMDT